MGGEQSTDQAQRQNSLAKIQDTAKNNNDTSDALSNALANSHNTNNSDDATTDERIQTVVERKSVSIKDMENYFGNDFPIVISPQIFEIRDEVTQIRRYFHQNPELSFQEANTSANIEDYLKDLGIVTQGIADTGLVALLNGANDGPCILLRASMDALPVQESKHEGNRKFRSINKGIMHANGHDAQMAILCATAKILYGLRRILHGSVKFVFEPSKENHRGAPQMIAENVLENPRVDQCYGFQLNAYDRCGYARVVSDALPFIAGNVSFTLELHGKGGHAAVPQTTHDSIVAVAHLCQQLYSIVPRNMDPLKSCALSIGQIHTNGRNNVIASHAMVGGCVRYFERSQVEVVFARVRQICTGIETSFKVQITFKIVSDTLPVINRNKECVDVATKTISQILPQTNHSGLIYDNEFKTTFCDDFGAYAAERPGCMFLLGCGVANKSNKIFAHNTGLFRIDERCLTIGAQILTTLVLERLVNWKSTHMQVQVAQD